MSEVETSAHTVMVPGIPEAVQKLPSDVMQLSDKMVLLTWVAFAVAAVGLHKLLWKPILKAVEGREKSISDALDGADRARKEQAEAERRGKQVAADASETARRMAEQASRDAAAAVARADRDAKAVAERRYAEAEREIEAAQRLAAETVRRTTAQYLGETLERMLKGHLTDEQRRAYQSEILSEVKL